MRVEGVCSLCPSLSLSLSPPPSLHFAESPLALHSPTSFSSRLSVGDSTTLIPDSGFTCGKPRLRLSLFPFVPFPHLSFLLSVFTAYAAVIVFFSSNVQVRRRGDSIDCIFIDSFRYRGKFVFSITTAILKGRFFIPRFEDPRGLNSCVYSGGPDDKVRQRIDKQGAPAVISRLSRMRTQ